MDVESADGRTVRKGVSTGQRTQEDADDVAAQVRRWQRSARKGDQTAAAALDAIVSGRRALAAAYDAACAGTLAQFVAEATAPEPAPVVDLDPLVDQWAATLLGIKTAGRYVKQVRRLIPKGQPFPITEFRRARISKHLAELTDTRGKRRTRTPATRPVEGPTRNRNKAALMKFGAWLVEREYLETNPVHDVKAYPESEPRQAYLTERQLRAWVAAMPAEGGAQCAAALMANGAEWGAVAHLMRRDLDLAHRPHPTAHYFPGEDVEGRKTRFRSRVAEITEAWTVPYIRAHAEGVPPNQRLVQIGYKAMWKTHDRTLAALKLPKVHLHDMRHSYIRLAKDRRDSDDRIKNQVGHSDRSNLIHTRYGLRRHDPRRTEGRPDA